MKVTKQPRLNSQIYVEASEWMVEFRSGDIDAEGRKAFYMWLCTSPEHMRAYLELAAVWNEGSSLDPNKQFDDAALLREVHTQKNVVPLEHDDPKAAFGVAMDGKAVGRPRFMYKWAAAAALFMAVVGIWQYQYRDEYSTVTGEQRTLAMSDGSRIELNAQSRVRVRFSQHAREVDLLEGQVLFQVAKDSKRPFVVRSNSARVTAVGTQFDVYRRASETTVTVIEGRVSVAPTQSRVSLAGGRDVSAPETVSGSSGSKMPLVSDDSRSSEFFLAAGEQAVIGAQTAVKQPHPNVSAATAWTEGHLVFQGTPLKDVVEQFNRYNTRQLVIKDSDLATLKVTGIFSSTDPSALIRFLEGRPDMTVTQSTDQIVVSRKH